MATTTRSESITQISSTPTLSSKALPGVGNAAQKTPKPAGPSQPRIDIEPLYTSLKAAIKEHWTAYKESVALFVLGELNQQELSRRVDHFIGVDPVREHQHNQFILAIYGNAHRDLPEPGVAPFVSANDKPTAVSKPASGDAFEQRLKTEVMHLPARERHRLKTIQDDPFDLFAHTMNEHHRLRQIKVPDIVPTSAGGFSNKTNWELEIRKRYAQPLASETAEFPDVESIQGRMVPICYEEGLVGGASQGCAEFMNVATETYIKEALSHLFGRVRSNGAGYIRTGAFKRQLDREEEGYMRGEISRDAAGFLPVEFRERERWQSLNLADLKLALQLGDQYLGQVPLISERILGGFDTEDDEDILDKDTTIRRDFALPAPKQTNGVPALTNGSHRASDEMEVDELDWGWQGASKLERDGLNSMLDDCLSIGL